MIELHVAPGTNRVVSVQGPTDHDVVYVPRRPGPLTRTPTRSEQPDEIDGVLDELFGEEDTSGPTATDAILVAGGVAAVAAGQATDLPAGVTVVGFGMVGLGVILPMQAAFRRLTDRRHRSRVSRLAGDGIALRLDDETLAELAQQYEHLLTMSDHLVSDVQQRIRQVAHSLVEEVATLLDGQLPAGPAEFEYVRARADSLATLVGTVGDPRIGDGDSVGRRARTEARLEVERAAGGSALDDAADLNAELSSDADG